MESKRLLSGVEPIMEAFAINRPIPSIPIRLYILVIGVLAILTLYILA